MSGESGIAPEQLSKALSDLKLSEDETRSVRQQLKETETALAANQKVMASLQREVENCEKKLRHKISPSRT